MWCIVWHGLVMLFRYYRASDLFHPSVLWWYFRTWCWPVYRPRGIRGLVPRPVRWFVGAVLDLLYAW